jgi:hypothetical protein
LAVRTSADLVSSVLRRCGENSDSTSPYYQQAIDYLDQIHSTVITGGNEFNLEVDEPWVWARARKPLVLEIQPYYATGSVSLTQGSVSGTFSSAPSYSTSGYFLKLDSGPEIYRIAQHTASSTSFSLDAAFPQTTVTGATFKAFKLDYDLVNDYITIDSENDRLDFIESGTTVLTGAITQGVYSPSGLATAVAAALNSAGTHTNTYSCSYDTIQRLFTVTSNLGGTGTPIFQPQGAGTNYYRSAWNTLGFDYSNQTGASSYTSTYAHSTIVRLIGPARCYYGTSYNYGESQGLVTGIDALSMEKNFPLSQVSAGTPTEFCVIREKSDGTQVIRLNKFTDRKMRFEVDHVAYPKSLLNNSASIPLIPRKFIRLLEFGATFYVLTDKRDAKAQSYYSLAQQTLQSMMKFNRKELERIGKNFGNIVARPDMVPDKRRYFLFGYDSGSL